MNNRDKQLCKFFPEGRCRRGENCSFIHSSNVTTTANFTVKSLKMDNHQKTDENNNTAERDAIDYISDKLSKVVHLRHKPQHRKQLRKVNTESFEPSYAPPDMRVVIAAPNLFDPRYYHSTQPIRFPHGCRRYLRQTPR